MTTQTQLKQTLLTTVQVVIGLAFWGGVAVAAFFLSQHNWNVQTTLAAVLPGTPTAVSTSSSSSSASSAASSSVAAPVKPTETPKVEVPPPAAPAPVVAAPVQPEQAPVYVPPAPTPAPTQTPTPRTAITETKPTINNDGKAQSTRNTWAGSTMS